MDTNDVVAIATSIGVVVTIVLVAVTAKYVRVTSGLLREAQTERADRRARERNEQARLIGGYIEPESHNAPTHVWLVVYLTNASPLPVRRVRARVMRDAQVVVEWHLNVLKPGDADPLRAPVMIGDDQGLHLDLRFRDESDVPWLKYASLDEPLRELGVDEDDLRPAHDVALGESARQVVTTSSLIVAPWRF